jgi:hypothetical protein
LSLAPDIVGEITAFEVEGQTGPANINTISRTVTVEIAGVDPAALTVTDIKLIETAHSELAVGSVLNLMEPKKVVVTTEADYEWTIVAVETDPRRPLPNGGLEQWHQPTEGRKMWLVYGAGDEARKFWDSGNEGTTILPSVGNVTFPADDPRPGSEGVRSARLASHYAPIVGIAAGSLYTGDFVSLSGVTGAKVDFGRPFTAAPVAMKFWYKSAPGVVDAVNSSHLSLGDVDKYRIFIALTDRTTPFRIDTTDQNTFVDWATHSDVIAFGELVSSDAVAAWTEYTITLNYRADPEVRRPRQIVVVASANMYGDYFTGSTGSVLCVDDFQLIYE